MHSTCPVVGSFLPHCQSHSFLFSATGRYFHIIQFMCPPQPESICPKWTIFHVKRRFRPQKRKHKKEIGAYFLSWFELINLPNELQNLKERFHTKSPLIFRETIGYKLQSGLRTNTPSPLTINKRLFVCSSVIYSSIRNCRESYLDHILLLIIYLYLSIIKNYTISRKISAFTE